MELNYDITKNLIIWGAGKRGKLLAKKLIELNIDFIWICNNPNKIGLKIYDIILKPWQKLNSISNCQSIITIANENSQTDIKAYFESRKMKNMVDYFFFC
jgi:phosphoribosylaminoimidazole carboxylase (NCAIR synthetase)